MEVLNTAIAHQASKYRYDYDLVVYNHVWLSTDHLPLIFGLTRKLLVV